MPNIIEARLVVKTKDNKEHTIVFDYPIIEIKADKRGSKAPITDWRLFIHNPIDWEVNIRATTYPKVKDG